MNREELSMEIGASGLESNVPLFPLVSCTSYRSTLPSSVLARAPVSSHRNMISAYELRSQLWVSVLSECEYKYSYVAPPHCCFATHKEMENVASFAYSNVSTCR